MGTYALITIIVLLIIGYFAWLRFRSRLLTQPYNENLDVFSDKLYFDNNGTTKPHPRVFEEMKKFSCCGNLSAKYALRAQLMISDAENMLLCWLGMRGHVIWTSGASESNNLFLRGVVDTYYLANGGGGMGAGEKKIPHIILSAIEHKTSIECAKQLAKLGRVEITFIEPRLDGTVEPMDIAYAIQPHTIAISIMHVNNEIGSINNIRDIAFIAAQKGILFHTDIVQSVGKWPQILAGINACASVSFHKLYGPTGVGALVLSPGTAGRLCAQVCGSQNSGLRGGTENVPAIAGARAAMRETFQDRQGKNKRLLEMKKLIIGKLVENFNLGDAANYAGRSDSFYISVGGGGSGGEIILFGPNNRNINTILVSFIKFGPLELHFCNIKLRDQLLKEGIIISIGSTCNTSSKNPSHVLMHLKMPFLVRCGVIRISLGDYNTPEQCLQFCKKLIPLAKEQFV